MPFYAVRRGANPGIYQTWDDCKEQVNGYSGARFKKFGSKQEAMAFVQAEDDRPSYSYSGGPRGGYGGGSVRFNPYSPPAQPQSVGKRRSSSTGYSGTGYSRSNNYKPQSSHPGYGYQSQDYDGAESDEEEDCYIPAPKSTKVSQKTVPPATRSSRSSAQSSRPVVFVDGACVHNGNWGGKAKAGVGVHWPSGVVGDISEPLAGAKQSNQRAEMTAACRALEQAHNAGLSSVEVCSDSMYTVRGINEWVPNWKKRGWVTAEKKAVENQDLWVKLDSLTKKVDVKWTHVRGHQGIWGNEKADLLARQGMNR